MVLVTAKSQTSKTLITTSAPAAAGFSGERLKRLDGQLQAWVDKKLVNGVNAIIIRNGKIAYYKSFGYENIDKKTPMRTDHIFRNASQTKAITSVAAMMLVEEGKMMLSDPISKFIPEFRNPQVIKTFNMADTTWTAEPAKREPTIKDLLTHTSGIGYALIGDPKAVAMYGKHRIQVGLGIPGDTLGPMIKRLGRLPLIYHPGDQWQYSLSLDVLGYVIEVVSGMSFDKFLKQRLFDPLGMKDTYFYQPASNHNRIVALHGFDSTGLHVLSKKMNFVVPMDTEYPKWSNDKLFAGGAGLSGTIMDYAIFLQMLLNGGTYNGKQILSRSTVRQMTANHITPNIPGAALFGVEQFGLGFAITPDDASISSKGTYEWGGAFATDYWVDPKENIVALIYFNMLPLPVAGKETFRQLTYQALAD